MDDAKREEKQNIHERNEKQKGQRKRQTGIAQSLEREHYADPNEGQRGCYQDQSKKLIGLRQLEYQ